jgi:hypothetical protein
VSAAGVEAPAPAAAEESAAASAVGGRWTETWRGLSRALNGACGGSGAVTFSAASYQLTRDGDPSGLPRVRFVDFFFGAGHCADGWRWHRARGLFRRLP